MPALYKLWAWTVPFISAHLNAIFIKTSFSPNGEKPYYAAETKEKENAAPIPAGQQGKGENR